MTSPVHPPTPDPENEPTASPRPFDGHADMEASYAACLAAVRERIAAGGEPWVPK